MSNFKPAKVGGNSNVVRGGNTDLSKNASLYGGRMNVKFPKNASLYGGRHHYRNRMTRNGRGMQRGKTMKHNSRGRRHSRSYKKNNFFSW